MLLINFNVKVYFSSRGFQLGKLTVYEGDCVLVRNADSFDPDSPDGCDIAKIIRCYDSGKHILSALRDYNWLSDFHCYWSYCNNCNFLCLLIDDMLLLYIISKCWLNENFEIFISSHMFIGMHLRYIVNTHNSYDPRNVLVSCYIFKSFVFYNVSFIISVLKMVNGYFFRG